MKLSVACRRGEFTIPRADVELIKKYSDGSNVYGGGLKLSGKSKDLVLNLLKTT